VFEDDAYFFNEYRWQQLQKAKAGVETGATFLSETPDQWFSTVGAVALDRSGNLAAATSTGGMTNKRWGRVGDSPIIGAGTYADNRACAVSGTGLGEAFIRTAVAYDIAARLRYAKVSLAAAAAAALKNVASLGADGGVIAVDRRGNVAMPFNSEGMFRACVDRRGRRTIAIF